LRAAAEGSGWVARLSLNSQTSQENEIMNPSQVDISLGPCSRCGKPLDPDSLFCKHCGNKQDAANPWSSAEQSTTKSAKSSNARTNLIILAAVGIPLVMVVGIVAIIAFVWIAGTHGPDPLFGARTNRGPAPSTTSTSSSVLTTENCQVALNQWATSLGTGQVTIVGGIQELPAQNAATAQLRFIELRYQSPRDNSAQVYSGTGVATFLHYTDGRWVLHRITFGQDNLGLGGFWYEPNIDIR
jgi:hypothetical protein